MERCNKGRYFKAQYKQDYQMTILVGLGLVSAIVIYPNTLTRCRAMIQLQGWTSFIVPLRHYVLTWLFSIPRFRIPSTDLT